MSSAMARLYEKRSSAERRAARGQQFPEVAVVGAGNGAGAQHALQFVTLSLVTSA